MFKFLKRFKKLKKRNLNLEKAILKSVERETDLERERYRLARENNQLLSNQTTLLDNAKYINDENKFLKSELEKIKEQYKNSVSKNKLEEMIDCLKCYSGLEESLQDILNNME